MIATIDIDFNDNGATGKAKGLTDEIGRGAEQTKSLKAQLRGMTEELARLEPGTQEFQNLAREAGNLRDQISDTQAVIQATAGGAVENLAVGLTKTAGIGIAAFQGIAGASALFGVESEKAQQIMAQLQGAMAVGDALNSFGALGDTITTISASFSAFLVKTGLKTTATVADTAATTVNTGATVANTAAQTAQTAATGGATTAQLGLNAAMLANPIFLVIAATAALVGALVIFSSGNDEAAESSERMRKQLDKTYETQDRNREKTAEAQDLYLLKLKLEGASEEQLSKAKERLGEANAKRDSKQADFAKKNAENLYKRYKYLLDEGEEDEAKKVREQITKSNERYKKLKGQASDYYSNLKKQRLEDAIKEKEEQDAADKEAAEKRKAAQEKYAADKKASLKDIADAEREFNLNDRQEAEYAVTAKYDKLIAEAKKYGKDSTTLELARQQGLSAIAQKYAEEDAAKQKAIDDKKVLDADEQWLKLQRLTRSQRELEELDIQLAFEKEYTAAGEDNELKLALEEKFKSDMAAIDTKYKDAKIASDKVISDKEIADAKAVAEAKASIQDSYLNSISSGLATLKSLGEGSKALQATALIGESAIGIAKIVISTQAANAAAKLKYAAIPGGLALAAAEITANKVSAAVGIAANLASTGKALSQLGKGNAPTPPSDTGDRGSIASASPNVNLYGSAGNNNQFGATPTNQSGTNGPIVVHAVVSATEVTSAQDLQNKIEYNSKL